MRYGAAGADGGEQLAEVLGQQQDVDVWRWLLEDFQEGIRCFLHEGCRGDDEDLGGGFDGERVRAVDQGADLAELDEQLRWIGWNDEDVRMRLDEDAGVLLVDFAHIFAGGYGFFDFGLEVGAFGDAGAVAAVAAEGG